MTDRQPSEFLCIADLLRIRAERNAGAIAISASGRRSLSYGRLWSHVTDVAKELNGIGVGRNDRIAMVLPNGPEMAVAFLATAGCATSAPLNPAYRADEFDFYFSQLRPKALIVQSGLDSPARTVARTRGLPVIELSPRLEEEAGIFDLDGKAGKNVEITGLAGPEDVAAVLLTSGTTSRSKLVPLAQAYICASVDKVRSVLQLRDDDRCLGIMPLFHVHGLLGALLASIAAGAAVVCTPGFYAPKFFEWLEEFHPTWYTAVPPMHQAILARAGANIEITSGSALRFIRSSSAPLPLAVMARLESTFHAPVIETYGLTEAFQITCNLLPPGERKAGSVGLPVNPRDIAIVDTAGNPLPSGEIGEIVIDQSKVAKVAQGGAGTAQDNELNPEWFRTGDQGFLDNDGYLFVTGRLKEIINRGGEQISPYEIEQVLLDHPAVAEAVIFGVPDTRVGEDIAAAVVLRDDATADQIRRFIATRLADFKIPNQVLFVNEIPKTSTGKPQRIGLAARLGITAALRPHRAMDFVAPRTSVEKMLAAIWVEVLGIERVGIHDDFFQLGGDSILVGRLIARLREAMEVDLSFVAFFEARTIAEMVGTIEAVRRTAPSLQTSSITPTPRNGELSASSAQERFWFLNELEPNNPAYHIAIVLNLAGPLNVAALEQSINEILRRHEALRTIFETVDGRPVQVIRPAQTITLEEVDLRGLPETEVRQLTLEESHRPFNLAAGPLLRATLARVTDQERRLLVIVHHIVFDGWSVSVFFRELSTLYDAFLAESTPSLPALPIQYVDFSRWQLQRLEGKALDRQLVYWKERLAGCAPLLELPTDRPRPTVRSYRGARRLLTLPRSLTDALKDLSEREGATLFMTLLAAFQTLLHRYSRQNDITVGTPIANRSHVDTEGLIGVFINTLVLRTDFSGNPTFLELLGRVRNGALGAYMHQDVPFEKLVSELQPERHLNHNPFFQTMFIFHNTPANTPELRDLIVQRLEIDKGTALYELTLELREGRGELNGSIEYATDLFDADTIARLRSSFQVLLEAIAADPKLRLSQLAIMTDAERRTLALDWNATRRDYPADKCLHELFEIQAERTPEAVAVIFEDQHLSYGELNARANRLARRLQSLGAGPGMLVGICVERSLEMIVGLLGILKAGAAYVPLDPTYPTERLAFMLEDSQASLLVTQQQLLKERFENRSSTIDSSDSRSPILDPRFKVICLDGDSAPSERESSETPVSSVTSDNLAYVIFTSGSTGKPKGVEIPHRAVVNLLHSMRHEPGLTDRDTLLSVTTLSFDIAALEIFLPLTGGGHLVLISRETAADGALLAAELARCNATAMQATPATWRLLLASGWQGSKRLTILCGGEALSPDLAGELVQKGFSACNLYGPTETTIWSTHCRIDAETDRIPIGRPIANTEIYILDSYLEPVPIGVTGELHIGGTGLARGYLNRPELTAEKFISNPFSNEPGSRMYKSGDLARYLPDGNIEFLGRIDHQVKLRGFRVELGEIETVLANHPAIREAVVLAREDTPNDQRLVAYVVPSRSPAPTLSELASLAKQKLPGYMLPSAFVVLDALPLMPNGKVDRRALPAPGTSRLDLTSSLASPRNAVETVLAEILAEVLELERVDINESFFDLGGHSLLAIQVVSRIRNAFHVNIPVQTFFELPTVAALAAQITEARAERKAAQMAHVLADLESLSENDRERMVAQDNLVSTGAADADTIKTQV